MATTTTATAPPEPVAAPASGRDRIAGIVTAALPPLAVWVGAAALEFLMVWWLHTPRPGGWLHAVLTPWDNNWYVGIAEQGYAHGFSYDATGRLTGNSLAFFPLYPMAIRLVAGVLGVGGQTASLIVAWLASAGAAVAVHRLGVRLFGARAGLVLVLLVFTQPMAITYWIGYSESLFLLLATCCLIAVHRQSWLTAGTLALLAGLARSTGVALTVALAAAVAVAVWHERRVNARAVAAVLVGAAGVPLYLLWVGARVGTLTAWLTIQRAGWNTVWDWGYNTVLFLGSAFQRGSEWVPVATAVLLVAAVACCVVALLGRTWPPLAVYGMLVLVLTLGQSNFYHSKLRLLAPALLPLVPLALAAARARSRAAVVGIALFSFFGTWFGAYMLTNWVYAI